MHVPVIEATTVRPYVRTYVRRRVIYASHRIEQVSENRSECGRISGQRKMPDRRLNLFGAVPNKMEYFAKEAFSSARIKD